MAGAAYLAPKLPSQPPVKSTHVPYSWTTTEGGWATSNTLHTGDIVTISGSYDVMSDTWYPTQTFTIGPVVTSGDVGDETL